MFFQKLPRRLQEAIKALTIDDVFQQRFGTDEVLNKLDEEKFDIVQCHNELCNSCGLPVVINGEAYNAVKLFQYVYLWTIDNSLIRDNKKAVTELDLDIFFYTLDNPITTSAVELAKLATGELRRRKLEINAAYDVANTLIHLAFSPLKMFPSMGTVEVHEQPAFDCDWMTNIIAKVHTVTGLTPKEIENMSLCACCFYYIQWSRMNGSKEISKRTSEEILKAQSERTDVLIAERLIEVGILKEEEKAEFLKTIGTPPENK